MLYYWDYFDEFYWGFPQNAATKANFHSFWVVIGDFEISKQSSGSQPIVLIFSSIQGRQYKKCICDPFCQDKTLLCTWSNLTFWFIIKIYILPFIMVVKILKPDNPISKVMVIGFQSLGFIIMSIANWARNHQKLHHLGFKLWS